MPLIDVSHPLVHGQYNFPFDPKLSIISHGTLQTLRYNMTQISIGSHQGAHVDAMYYFLDEGYTIDQMPLDWFYGPAWVLRIPKAAGEEIVPDDFKPFEEHLIPEAKIIYETRWHHQFGQKHYFSDFPSLTHDAARYMVSRGIRMLEMDTLTSGRDWYKVHHILLASDAEVVESLANLDQLPSEFTLIGFPMNLQGRDGSPIRAVAVTAEVSCSRTN